MKVSSKVSLITATLTLLAVTAMSSLAAPHGLTSLSASAHGEGTLTIGQETFKVSNVVVTLREDGTGEIVLVTDLQLFVTCKWSTTADLSKGVDLNITGGTNPGTIQGTGKLFLRPDGKSIASLSIDASSNSQKRKIEVKFVAD